MTALLSGWIEARNPTHSFAGWMPVLTLDLFAAGQQNRLGQFFMKLPDAAYPPVAADRGLPSDASALVQREAGLCETRWGQTWCVWGEIAPFAREDVVGTEWAIMLAAMRLLAEHYGGENVRLIVWFYVNM
jgi:hypothetical protein